MTDKITCACSLLLCLIIGLHGTTTQSIGTVGREFLIAILKTYGSDPEFSILISSKFSGQATISIPHLSINTTRSFNRSLVYNVTHDIITSFGQKIDISQKGVRVTTDVDVSVTVIKYPSDMYEGFLVLPTSMLSTRYIIASSKSDDTYQSEFLILADDNNTVVNIHIPKSNRFNITLDSFNTYLHGLVGDLSGTIVQSNKPIAVFSGHQATAIPYNCGYRSYLVEQILPTKFFAKEFIVPPVHPKTGFITRVFSSENNTHINFANSTSTRNRTISEVGGFFDILSTTEPLHIIADKPVQVILFGSCRFFDSDDIGNGIMVVVPSVHQFRNEYQFIVSSQFDQFSHYLAIISKGDNVSNIRLDGLQLTNSYKSYPMSSGRTNYLVNVIRIYPGDHTLDHVAGETFGALLYGFESTYSYGYMLGMNESISSGNCGIPIAPGNGSVSTVNGTSYKSTASFSCNIGFDLVGSNVSVCKANGTWSNPMPTCVIKDCGPLYPPLNGAVNSSTGSLFRSEVTFTCMSGYTLHGNQMRTCMSDGNWSGLQPTCQLTVTDDGPTCLNCKDMSNLYMCDTITTCSKGQVCYVETFTTNDGRVKYNSGCLDSQRCSQRKRRSSECVHCCSSQLCNMNGCGSRSLPAADQRGPLCYDCAYFSSIDECKTMKLCSIDEVCSIEKYDWGGLYDHYTAKCHSKQCISHKRPNTGNTASRMSSRSTPVCQSCCNTDLCNVGCNVTSQAGTGSSIVG